MTRRGGAWEAQLEIRHDQYRRDGLAWIAKSNPSMRVVNGKPIFSSKGAPDYVGVVKPGAVSLESQMVVFDAKSIDRETWPFDKLALHQAKDLESVSDKGGCAFLVIRTTTGSYLMRWPHLREGWWQWHERHRPGSRAAVPAIGKGNGGMFEIDDGTDWIATLKRWWF